MKTDAFNDGSFLRERLRSFRHGFRNDQTVASGFFSQTLGKKAATRDSRL